MGYSALCVAILERAKLDNAKMWKDFKKTEIYRRGKYGRCSTNEIVEWVAEYIT